MKDLLPPPLFVISECSVALSINAHATVLLARCSEFVLITITTALIWIDGSVWMLNRRGAMQAVSKVAVPDKSHSSDKACFTPGQQL